MQWHVHDNLCWGLDEDGEPVVVGVTDADRQLRRRGTVNAGGDNPMVHVWIAPHECGPFAALEGHGAGQAGRRRAAHRPVRPRPRDGDGDARRPRTAAAVAATPYDPTKPIDLSGVDGVTPEQQAFAENLVATHARRPPAVGRPGRRRGGRLPLDRRRRHRPRALHPVGLDRRRRVARPGPPREPRLRAAAGRHEEARVGDVHAADDVPLDDVPDYGGPLMQWHIHDNLCFTDDPVAPQVARPHQRRRHVPRRRSSSTTRRR